MRHQGTIHRKRFLKQTDLGSIAVGGPHPAADTPEEAIRLLQQGNERFLKGAAQSEAMTARRLELAAGQNPFAAVLGCSDSRVPLETLFDQKAGDLFVVRVAGNFVDDAGLGSLEYAVAVLRTPLVVVLGHTGCGAVGATIDYLAEGTTQPGHIMDIIRQLESAVKQTENEPGDWLHNAVVQNVRNNTTALTQRSAILADAVNAEKIMIVGGVYDLHSGRISALRVYG